MLHESSVDLVECGATFEGVKLKQAFIRLRHSA